jgi:tetratricopeptide (TPR) repeat protein
LSSPSFQRPPKVPPEITFVTLPVALAQFHHLPLYVPIWIHQQEKVEKNGYDFKEGVGVMEDLLKQAPGVPGAYLYQLFVRKWPKLMAVNSYFESGRIAEAIPKLVEVLEIDPECPLTCFQLGFCFRATGELEKSESFYRQALRMAPDAGWIHSNLGRTYQVLGDKARATKAFWKALELLPGDHFVLEQLIGLGELFAVPQEEKGKSPSVVFVRRTDYEKKMEEIIAKEAHPGNLLKLGWKLLQDHLNGLAVRCFEKARSLDKGLIEALLGLGTAYLESGRFKDAECFLGEYLDTNPESAAGHLNLFKVYVALDERELAWDEIQTAVRLDPNRLDSLQQLYFLFRETDRQEEGLEWMNRLARENPASFAPLLVKAQGLAAGQNWPEAEAALKVALKRAPHNEELLLYYSSELGKRGLKKDLIQLLEAQSEPLPLSLTINLALAHSQSGRLDKGRQILKDFLGKPGLSGVDAQRAQAILREFEKPL